MLPARYGFSESVKTLRMYAERCKCLKRYNAGWPFPGKPGNDHNVPTAAAMHSVMAL